MTTQLTKVAVLGAGGTMGFPIARNLARSGLEVRAWNRSREKAQPLESDGVQVLEDPAAAGAGAEVVLTMLADADAVLAAMGGKNGALSSAAGDAVWVQMSTIGEAGTKRCAELAKQHGIAFVDAPVLGTRKPAQDGELIVMASGPEEQHDRLQRVFDAIANKVMWIGDAGQGSRLKLVTNSWVLAVVECGAETIALAEGLGIDPHLLFDAIDGGTLNLPYLRMKGESMMDRDFDADFRLALAAKDAGLVEQSAREHELDLPVLSTVAQRLREGADEHGDQDFSATYLTSAPQGAAA